MNVMPLPNEWYFFFNLKLIKWKYLNIPKDKGITNITVIFRDKLKQKLFEEAVLFNNFII